MKTKIYWVVGIIAVVTIGVIIYKKTKKGNAEIATKELAQTKELMV